MARKAKSLEDKLSAAIKNRNETKLKLLTHEEEIKAIQQQIEERNMKEMYAYAKEKGITLDTLKNTFESPKKKIS